MPKKNILFIMTDQMRLDALGCVSAYSKTPNLDELAHRGILFTSCYTDSPVCVPARMSLATGLSPQNIGVDHNVAVDLSPYCEMWTKDVFQNGYSTSVFGKTHLHRHEGDIRDREHLINSYGFSVVDEIGGPRASTFIESNMTDLWRREGYLERYKADIAHRMESDRLDTSPSVLPLNLYADTYVGDQAGKYLKSVKTDKPWFCWVSFGGPHEPWDAPDPYDSMFSGEPVKEAIRSCHKAEVDGVDSAILKRLYNYMPDMSKEKIVKLRENYAGNVKLIDDQIGNIIEILKERDMFDNTVIVFVSDHGEMNGDHDLVYKEVFFESSVKIPLIISTPKTRMSTNLGGRTCKALVNLSDLGGTVLDLVNIEPSRKLPSFVGCISNKKNKFRNYVVSQSSGEFMLRTKRWKAMFNREMNLYMLFDLKKDPNELKNLIIKRRYSFRIRRMKNLLKKHLSITAIT